MITRNPNNYYVVNQGRCDDFVIAEIFHDSDWDKDGNYLENKRDDYSFKDSEDKIVFVTTDWYKACEVCNKIINGEEWQ